MLIENDAYLERLALFTCLVMDNQSPLPHLLTPEDFNDETHGKIFQAIQRNFAEKGKCSFVDLCTHFETELLLNINAFSTMYIPTSAEDIAKSMRELRIRRVAKKFSVSAEEAKAMIQEITDHAKTLTELLPNARRSTIDVFDELHNAPVPVIPMGFSQIDSMLSMHRGDLITVGARTAHGKTAFLINIAAKALGRNERVDFLTKEMKDRELLPRFITNLTGKPHPASLAHIDTEIIDRLHIHNFMSIQDIASICAQSDAAIICVDYIQLIDSGRKSENRAVELEYVTGQLKAIAMSSDKCIIAAAQLSRTLDNASREPVLSDLKGSGSIEQDSNAVILLYNHAKDSKTEGTARSLEGTQDMVDIHIAKNRIGQTGKIQMHWNAPLCQFTTPSTL
jgi:replicative DNA helicase